MGAVSGAKAKSYMEVAAGITRTCWQMYDRMPSGEALAFDPMLSIRIKPTF